LLLDAESKGLQREQDMADWVGLLVVLVVWTLIQTWLLPKLGVPT
jgi:hypothetical protein